MSGKYSKGKSGSVVASRDDYDAFNRIYDHSMLSVQNVQNLACKTLGERGNHPAHVDVCAIGSDHRVGRFLRDRLVDFIGKDDEKLSLALCRGTPDRRTGEIRGASHWTALHLRKVIGADGKTHIKIFHADSMGSRTPAAVSSVIGYVRGITRLNYLDKLSDSPDVAAADSTLRAIERMSDVVLDSPINVICERQIDGYSCGYHAAYNAVAMHLSPDLSAATSLSSKLKRPAVAGAIATTPISITDFIAESKPYLVSEFGGHLRSSPTGGKAAASGRRKPSEETDSVIKLVEIVTGDKTYLEKIKAIQAIETSLKSKPELLSSLSLEDYYGVILGEISQSLRADLIGKDGTEEINKKAEEILDLLVSPKARNNVKKITGFLSKIITNPQSIKTTLILDELKTKLDVNSVEQKDLSQLFVTLSDSRIFEIEEKEQGSKSITIFDSSSKKHYRICEKDSDKEGIKEYSIEEYSKDVWHRFDERDLASNFDEVCTAVSNIEMQAAMLDRISLFYGLLNGIAKEDDDHKVKYHEIILNNGWKCRLNFDEENAKYSIQYSDSDHGTLNKVFDSKILGQIFMGLEEVISEKLDVLRKPELGLKVEAATDTKAMYANLKKSPGCEETVVTGSSMKVCKITVEGKEYAIFKDAEDFFLAIRNDDNYEEITDSAELKSALLEVDAKIKSLNEVKAKPSLISSIKNLFDTAAATPYFSVLSGAEGDKSGNLVSYIEFSAGDGKYAVGKKDEQYFIMKSDPDGSFIVLEDEKESHRELDLAIGFYAIERAIKTVNQNTSRVRATVPEISNKDAAKFILLAVRHEGIGHSPKDSDLLNTSIKDLFGDKVDVPLYKKLAATFSASFQKASDDLNIESERSKGAALRLCDVSTEFAEIILNDEKKYNEYMTSLGLSKEETPRTSISSAEATPLLRAQFRSKSS